MTNIPVPKLPDPPQIPAPPVVSTKVTGKVSQVDLVAQINLTRGQRDNPGNPKLPEGPEFRNLKTPLRVEIKALLDRILPDATAGATPRDRNRERLRVVTEYINTNYPGNTRLLRKIADDLLSYPEWEEEEDA